MTKGRFLHIFNSVSIEIETKFKNFDYGLQTTR